jgi:predicted nuclease of predicted toxin-antitoxin system
MKILLDEDVSYRLAELLRAKGFDVTSVLEVRLQGEPDPAVWRWAIGDGRVLVTYNTRDFLTLAVAFYQAGIRHPGLVVISSKSIPQGAFGAKLLALERLLKDDPDLADQILFLGAPASP